MFDRKAMAAQIDGRVLALLWAAPDSDPLETIAERAGLTMLDLRASMTRLALRVPGENWPKAEA